LGQINKNRSQIAYLNECKGYLFEYALSAHLSKVINQYEKFVSKIPPNLEQMILKYQTDLYQMAPGFVEKIQRAVEESSKIMRPYLNEADEISLVGKVGHNDESDILFLKDDQVRYGVSVKLSFQKSDLHTKSAGYQSILLKYFKLFDKAGSDQSLINEFLDYEYRDLAYKLYQSMGMEISDDFNQWKASKQPTLPGDLKPGQREILHLYYEKLSIKLYQILSHYYERGPERFIESLLPLAGISSPSLIYLSAQITDKEDIIQLKSQSDYLRANRVEFAQQRSYVDINLFSDNEKIVRIKLRIKPMNEFVQIGVKVNASVSFSS